MVPTKQDEVDKWEDEVAKRTVFIRWEVIVERCGC